MKKIAILTSNKSHGTNTKALIRAVKNKTIPLRISTVMSDAADAEGLAFAKDHRIPTYVVDNHDDIVILLTKKYPTDYICLAGWKQIITDDTIDAFPNRILNIHPGLIPDSLDGCVTNPDGTCGLWNKGKFQGKAIENYLKTNSTYAGCSLHFLTHEFDFGPVIARRFVKIKPDDTVDSLYGRIKQQEHVIYIKALQKLTT